MGTKKQENNYKSDQEEKQIKLLEEQAECFYGAHNRGIASWKDEKTREVRSNKSRKVLQPTDRLLNLYEPIRNEVLQYMSDKQIAWWHMPLESREEPTAHVMSSQIACLNHLFAIRNDKAAILDILYAATAIRFDNVLPSLIDTDSLISFEFTYENAALLGENDSDAGRGTMCTSVDAMIHAVKDNGSWLIPIEWKYTETYEKQDKTCEKRLNRYEQRIIRSSQLKTPKTGAANSVYMQEPYYELMRQTLLVEKMVEKKLADHFLHICVVPNRNTTLRDEIEKYYIPMLQNPSLFHLVDPEELLQPLEQREAALFAYLKQRYWN